MLRRSVLPWWLLSLALAAGRAEPAPALAGAETFVYRDGAPEPLRLFVLKPAGWTAQDRRTALVFFFGGGWTHGTPERAAAWGRFAAEAGMVGVLPDYRTKERFNMSPLAAVADGRAAVHWVQEHAVQLGVDPKRIVVGGDSSGGHLALWTAISAPPPGAAASESPRFKPAALLLFSAVSDTSPETGYTPARFGAEAGALSPLHHLDSPMPPTLIVHGDADRTVPFGQSARLRDRLAAGGAACELMVIPRGEHGFLKEQPAWRERAEERVLEFLRRQGLLPPVDGR